MTDEFDWLPVDAALACESPIEFRLAGGLAALYTGGECSVRFCSGVDRAKELENIRDAEKFPGLWLHVFPQEKVGPYRVDFLILGSVNGSCLTIIAECDGKEFHQDKAKDAERDAYMDKLGYWVKRFPGSDIWRDPRECARRIMKFVDLLDLPTEQRPQVQEPLYPDIPHIWEHLQGVLPVTYWGWLGDQLKGRKDQEGEQ